MCILWFRLFFLSVHVQECCVCVSIVVAKWVGLRVHVFGFSVQGKLQCVGKGWSRMEFQK